MKSPAGFALVSSGDEKVMLIAFLCFFVEPKYKQQITDRSK